jgi:hypothetical protein
MLRNRSTEAMQKSIALRCMVASLFLTGCQTMASAAGHPTGDTRNWQVHRVQVEDKFVEFRIPSGESKEFPTFRIPTKIDLQGNDVFDEAMLGPALLSRTWDYQASRFVHVDGTLSASIEVSASEHDLVDIEAIKRAVQESSRRFSEKADKEEGRPRASNPPKNFDPVTIEGTNWVCVRHHLSGPYYVTPLDARHYLEVSVNAEGFTRADWRADAQAAADAILRSIRILPAN